MKSDTDIKKTIHTFVEMNTTSAPSFDQTWSKAKAKRQAKQLWKIGSLLAAACLIFAVLYFPPTSDISTTDELVSLSEWQAPSDIWFADVLAENYDVEFSTELTVPTDEFKMID